MNAKQLRGIYPALVTPYTADNNICEQSLRAIVDMNIKKGVSGFYVGGSTGEAFVLSLEERKSVLEIVADEVKGRVNIISHIGCISTDQAIELGLHAKSLGVNAVSAVPPFYYKFSFDEIKKHYFAIADAVQLPFVVYNIPSMSGVELTADNVRELRQNPYIVGIKHTCMNLFQLERMRAADKDLLIFNGHDEVCLAGLSMGADGAIGSTYNVMAEKFLAIEKLFLEKKQEEAYAIQAEANQVIDTLIHTGVFGGVKYILFKKYGIDCGPCRAPFVPLTVESKALLDDVIKKYL